MKLVLSLMLFLIGAAFPAPANKVKRDILPGDPRYGTDHHHHHHHPGNANDAVASRAVEGYPESYKGPARTYGPPNHTPGQPFTSSDFAATHTQQQQIPQRHVYVQEQNSSPELHHQVQEQHYHHVQQPMRTYLVPNAEQYRDEQFEQSQRKYLTPVNQPQQLNSYGVPVVANNAYVQQDSPSYTQPAPVSETETYLTPVPETQNYAEQIPQFQTFDAPVSHLPTFQAPNVQQQVVHNQNSGFKVASDEQPSDKYLPSIQNYVANGRDTEVTPVPTEVPTQSPTTQQPSNGFSNFPNLSQQFPSIQSPNFPPNNVGQHYQNFVQGITSAFQGFGGQHSEALQRLHQQHLQFHASLARQPAVIGKANGNYQGNYHTQGVQQDQLVGRNGGYIY